MSEPPAAEHPLGDPFEAKPRAAHVIAGYRWILGRVPEDEGVVARRIARLDSIEGLRRELLHSAELRTLLGADVPPGLPHDAPALPIGLEASPAELDTLHAGLARSWTRLGQSAPHWSCLPEERFRPEPIAGARRAFYGTGLEERALVEGVLARLGIPADRVGRGVDFGCGVGRATVHLAAICPDLAGVDISAPHLALARAEARARGMDHIRWVRSRADRPMPVEGYGLWFSRRVLQHCPPPLARHLLALAFAGLAPGGVAIFQLVTYGFGYGFPTADHLSAPIGPELHVLPQAEVFALAAAAGLSVIEVQEDILPGLDRRHWVSHLFVMVRPG